MSIAAVLLLLCAEVGGANWKSPPATPPAGPVWLWFRYVGSDEADPIGVIARLQRGDGNPDDMLVVQLNYGDPAVESGLARAGQDYEPVPTTVVIPSGAPWLDVNIVFIDDDTPEWTESISMWIESVRVFQRRAATRASTRPAAMSAHQSAAPGGQ